MNEDFEPGMKVSHSGENGLVLDEYYTIGSGEKTYGVILWDTGKENDTEDWRGLFGSFQDSGGAILEKDFKFTHIKEDEQEYEANSETHFARSE